MFLFYIFFPFQTSGSIFGGGQNLQATLQSDVHYPFYSRRFSVSYYVVAFFFWDLQNLDLNSSCRLILKTQSERDCHLFCVHIYNKLNSLCIYSTYTVQEHHLLFIAHCFVKGLHLFLILWYFWLINILEKQWQQQLRKL